MNCEDARPLLDSFADGELDLVNHVQLETHLEECLACDHDYRDRAALKKALSDDELYFHAPTELRSKIRSSLSDASAEPFYKRFFKWRWTPTLAMAALLVIALVTTLSILRPTTDSDDLLANEIVSAHIRSMMVGDPHLMDVPSTDQHTVKPWFEGKLDFSPPVVDLGQKGFTLIGGRLDYAGGRPIAAIVYQRRLHVINVFVYPGQQGNTAATTSTRQGFNIVHWTRNGMTFWAVSDLNAVELHELATDLQS